MIYIYICFCICTFLFIEMYYIIMHYVRFQLVSLHVLHTFHTCRMCSHLQHDSLYLCCRLQHMWPRIDVHRTTRTPPVRACSLPKGSVLPRLRCHFAGARSLGFRDRQHLLTDAGLCGSQWVPSAAISNAAWTAVTCRPEFPQDFPETQAGQGEAARQATKQAGL